MFKSHIKSSCIKLKLEIILLKYELLRIKIGNNTNSKFQLRNFKSEHKSIFSFHFCYRCVHTHVTVNKHLFFFCIMQSQRLQLIQLFFETQPSHIVHVLNYIHISILYDKTEFCRFSLSIESILWKHSLLMFTNRYQCTCCCIYSAP